MTESTAHTDTKSIAIKRFHAYKYPRYLFVTLTSIRRESILDNAYTVHFKHKKTDRQTAITTCSAPCILRGLALPHPGSKIILYYYSSNTLVVHASEFFS